MADTFEELRHAHDSDVAPEASGCLHAGVVIKCDASRLVAEINNEAEGRAQRVKADPVLPTLGRPLGGGPVVAERLVPDAACRL
jgi:hypothetical protein